mmetsp:Transcript_17717/g.35559  ORF Transcript_17717/g.35559 Transcript_17717/m.35559 type:complete len:177 (-) Transcript_17717:1598-2128(-)
MSIPISTHTAPNIEKPPTATAIGQIQCIDTLVRVKKLHYPLWFNTHAMLMQHLETPAVHVNCHHQARTICSSDVSNLPGTSAHRAPHTCTPASLCFQYPNVPQSIFLPSNSIAIPPRNDQVGSDPVQLISSCYLRVTTPDPSTDSSTCESIPTYDRFHLAPVSASQGAVSQVAELC